MKKRSVAVVGAGFCGVALSWYLLQDPENEVTLYEEKEVGSGASGTAAGLMHTFAGAHAKYNWRGKEGMDATKELLSVAEEELKTPVSDISGVLRIALTEQQKNDFQIAAERYAELSWISATESQKRAPGVVHAPALWIPSGISVDSLLYLKGLMRACQRRGLLEKRQKINSIDQLSSYNTVVLTTGAATSSIEELHSLKIGQIKGQILKYPWPEGVPPLSFPLISQVYLVMDSEKKNCFVGATFERTFATKASSLEVAEQLLHPKVSTLFPPLASSSPIECKAGIRATAPNHHPLIKKVADNCFVLTGMGSKGLLYHALYAKELAEIIALDSDNSL